MSHNPYAMAPSRQRQQYPPASASTYRRQQHPSSSGHRTPSTQQSQKTLVTCNKCGRNLTTTIFLYGCRCLICEDCATKGKCPCCNRKVDERNPVRELLITAASDKYGDNDSAATAAKTELSQWLFVKMNRNAEPLKALDVYNRLCMQHRKQKEVTAIVLKQLISRTGLLQRECVKYRNGVSSTRNQEVELKQELHKRKQMFDAQTAKVESLTQQLQQKQEQVAKFRRLYEDSPSKFSSPMQQRQPSRQSMNPAEVSADSMPPALANQMNPQRSSRDPRMASSRTRGGYGPLHHQIPSAPRPQPQYQQHQRPNTPMPQQQQQYLQHHGHGGGGYQGQSTGRTGQQPPLRGNPYDGTSGAYSSRQSHGGQPSRQNGRQYAEQRLPSRQQRPQGNPYDGQSHAYANAVHGQSRSSQSGQQSQSHRSNPYDQPININRGASPQQRYHGGNTYAGSGGSVAGSIGSRSSNSASGRIIGGLEGSTPFAFSGGAKRASYGRNGY